MTLFARLRSIVSGLLRRSTLERDMDDELRFHIESYAADLMRAGATRAEAFRRARAEFGGVEANKDSCREARGLRLFDEARADMRYALRQLRRAPLFAAVAIVSLGLGIGANTAIFSLMEQALWKTMPVASPGQLRLFTYVSGPNAVMNSTNGNWSRAAPAGGNTGAAFSYAIFEAMRQRASSFEQVIAFKPFDRLTAVVDNRAELVGGQLVSGNYYDGLAVVPILGRAIAPGDDDSARTGGTVGVISEGFWARRFGRDPAVIGRTIRVNLLPVTIVGVNPPGFTGLESGERPDLFLPLAAQPGIMPRRFGRSPSMLEDPDTWWLPIVGRLKAGVSDARAQSEADLIMQQVIHQTLPDRAGRDQPRMRLLAGSRGMDNLRETFGTPLLVLFAFVALVLLIACANVANLLLARAAVRRRELSLRLALGAGRWRIARQLLTEGFTLGLGGGLLGLLIGYAARDVIPSFLVSSWQSWRFDAAFDTRVLLLAMAVTIMTSVLFSLAPIWHFMRVDLNTALKDGGRALGTATPLRGKALIVFQVGLCVLLLVGAGLFLRTLSNLRAVSLGFTSDRVVLFAIDPPQTRYKGHARTVLYGRLEERIAAIPGVESASLSESPLVGGGSSTSRVGPNGSRPGPNAWVNDIGYRFMTTMGIPIVAGRGFDAHDSAEGPPVTVINQRFARELFPNEDPIGRTLTNNNRLFQIVGICGDAHFDRARTPPPRTFYRLFTQNDNLGPMTVQVRTSAPLAAIVASVREAVDGIDKELPLFDVRTQEQQIDDTLASERLFATLTAAFGLLALLLACIGIYGVMAHNVSRRTGEIGIRIALGARRADVLLMILRQATWLAILGVTLGAGAAAWLGRYVRSMLFGIQPVDPLTIGSAIAIMLLVAMFAGWLPARRAARVDPMVALRND
jgi:predicted permease